MPSLKFFLFSCGGFIISFYSFAQVQPKRSIRFQNLGKDSIRIALNEEYYLIEDSCAQIIRYARYDAKRRLFTGKFRDVPNSDAGKLISEGEYNENGLKNGDFVSYYLNGNLQSKGSFKNNKFSGRWDLFFDDGKPKLSFEANGNDIKIIDAWDAQGKKTVDNGNGNYRADLGGLYWAGKLENGKPDGKWKAIRTEDRTNTELATESFKNGVFQKGGGMGGDYKDASRIMLVSETTLPFVNAEKMRISSVPCDGVKKKHIVNAQYHDGFNAFSEEIKRLVSPYLSKVDLRPYDTEVTFNGEISEKGYVSINNYTPGLDDKIASGLERELRRLPSLEPALVDGKPVAQKFTITFKFRQGGYSFNYRFLPVGPN